MEKELMKEAMHDACIRAVTEISADVKALVQAALDRETNETAKSMLSSMLENLDIAKAQDKAVCQSPGYPTTWISYGDDNFPSFAKETIAEALGEATKKGYLRPSIVDPLTRHNPGNNTGKGVPNIEYQYNPGQDYVDFIISFKGCGAELGNAMKIFTTATLKLDKDFEGLKRFVLETAINAGGKPCPPFGIGIGIGGIGNLLPSMIGNLFNRHDFARALGIINVISLIIRSFTFSILAFGLERLGGFAGAYAIVAALNVIGIVLCLLIKDEPVKP